MKGKFYRGDAAVGAPKCSGQLEQRVEAALLQKADNLSPVHGKLQKLHAAARSTRSRSLLNHQRRVLEADRRQLAHGVAHSEPV